MTATTLPRLANSYRDYARQLLNLIFAIAQFLVVAVGYALGSNATFDRNGPGDPPIVPPAYAFAVWTPIFLGSLLYARLSDAAIRRARRTVQAGGAR